eukprot:6126120-Pyramimonas_sp.AAC.1
MYAAMFSVWVLSVRGHVDGEVVTGSAPTRVEVVTHEQTLSRGLVKLSRRLVEVRAQKFPKDANTRKNHVSLEGFSEVNVMR